MEYKLGDIYARATPHGELIYYIKITNLWYRNGNMSHKFPVGDRDITACLTYNSDNSSQLLRGDEIIEFKS